MKACLLRTARSWPFAASATLSAGMLAVLCLHLLVSAYTSGDDGYTTMAALDAPNLWTAAKQMAVFQGRFYQLVTYPLAMLPYVSESLTITNLFRIYTFLIFLAGFTALCRELVGWRGAICCVALFLCLFDTVGGLYNAFHGLPLWFGLGYGLLLFSLSAHIHALRNNKSSALAFGLYGVSLLTYEIVLLYAPAFLFLTWFFQARQYSASSPFGWRSLYRAFRSNIPVARYCVIYLAFYVGFRHYYPGTYTGAEGLSLASTSRIAKPILEFSMHSLYWHFSSMGNQTLSLGSLLFAVAGVLAVSLCLVSAEAPSTRHPSRHITLDTAIAVLFLAAYVFVPNVLFGFTDRYRIWAGDGVQVYLGSELSAVALVILLFLALRWSWRHLRHSLPGQLILTSILFSLLTLSYANAKNANNFYEQSKEMAVRWPVADWASSKLKSVSIDASSPLKLCESGFTHTTELYTYFRNPDMLADINIFWSRYFSRSSGRVVEVVNDPMNTQSGCSARLRLSYLQRDAVLFTTGAQGYSRYTWQ